VLHDPAVGSVGDYWPGVCIRSTWKNDRYKIISGTSMTSPYVTETAALCIASGACAANNPSGTMTKLRTDAQQQSNPMATPYYGFVGDPNSSTGVYYGYLEFTGDY
jgi:subtilisin family serine protease